MKTDKAFKHLLADIDKAIDLLVLKRCIPDFIILSGGIGGLDPGRFFDALSDEPLLRDIRVIAYGEWDALRFPRVNATIEADLSYSELKDALRKATEGK